MPKKLFNPVLWLTIAGPLLLGYFYLIEKVDPDLIKIRFALEVAVINTAIIFMAAWFFSGTGLLNKLNLDNSKVDRSTSYSTFLIIISFTLVYLLNLQLLQIIVAQNEQSILDRGYIVVLIAALFLEMKQAVMICVMITLVRIGFYFSPLSIYQWQSTIAQMVEMKSWKQLHPSVIALVAALLNGVLTRSYFININARFVPPWIGFTMALIIEPIYLGGVLANSNIYYVWKILITESVPYILANGATIWLLLYMLHGLKASLEAGNSRETELAILQENLKYLRIQMNPHFLFNSLNTISHFIIQKPEYAKELLLDLSDMFRHVIRDETILVPLETELDYIKMYISLEKARLGDRLTVNYKIDRKAMSWKIPTLILQPLVENSIKHGISQPQQKIQVTVQCIKQGDNLVIKISDNGKGINIELNKKKHHGISLKNIRKRLSYLYGDKAVMHIKSVPEKGVFATLVIPRYEMIEKQIYPGK